VDEEDAEVEVVAVTTQLVEEEEDVGVEVVAVSTQLVEEKNVELAREEEEVRLHDIEKKRGGRSGKNERRTVNPHEDVRSS
jgi:hypothetical protein